MQFDSRILSASDFVEKLVSNASVDPIRCPYLANLEIERRKLLFGKGDFDKLIEALIQYFSRSVSSSLLCINFSQTSLWSLFNPYLR